MKTEEMTGKQLQRALKHYDLTPNDVAARAGCSAAEVRVAFETMPPSPEIAMAIDVVLHERRMWELRKWRSTLEFARAQIADAGPATIGWARADEQQALRALRTLADEGSDDEICAITCRELLATAEE